ncbi:transposase [Trebonia kvetii]|nr:transposase [Trebonia kvetii]
MSPRCERNTDTRRGRAFVYSPSYFAASCGGAPLESIKEYIEQRKRPA